MQYHLSASGNLKPCEAVKRPCPLGGVHISEESFKNIMAGTPETFEETKLLKDLAVTQEKEAEKQNFFNRIISAPKAKRDNLFEDFDSIRGPIQEGSDQWRELLSAGLKSSSKMTLKEKLALKRYTFSDYPTIRDYLMTKAGKKPVSPVDSRYWTYPAWQEGLEDDISALDSFLSKGQKPAQPRKVYRGLKLQPTEQNPEEWINKNFPVGETVQQHSFLSTSSDAYHVATRFAKPKNPNTFDPRSVMIEFLTKEGTPLAGEVSTFSEESEVLLPRDQKFKVHAVHKDVEYKSVSSRGEKHTARLTVIQLIDV